MTEKDKIILETFHQIADALSWINTGGKDITEDVNVIYGKISELKSILR